MWNALVRITARLRSARSARTCRHILLSASIPQLSICITTQNTLLCRTCMRVVKQHGCCTLHFQAKGSLCAPQHSSVGCICESALAGRPPR